MGVGEEAFRPMVLVKLIAIDQEALRVISKSRLILDPLDGSLCFFLITVHSYQLCAILDLFLFRAPNLELMPQEIDASHLFTISP